MSTPDPPQTLAQKAHHRQLRLFGIMKPQIPPPSRLWLVSQSFMHAGDLAYDSIQAGKNSPNICFPCLFCYARSIELALKVILIVNEVPEKTILKLGHHLSRLADEVKKFISLQDLNIEAPDVKFIQSFSEDYANKWYEYPETLWGKKPQLEKLRGLAHKVVDSTKDYWKRTWVPRF